MAKSSPVNFSYGFQQPGDTDFAGYNVLAWVGVDSPGTADNGYILSVNARPLPAVLDIVPSGGKVTAFAM